MSPAARSRVWPISTQLAARSAVWSALAATDCTEGWDPPYERQILLGADETLPMRRHHSDVIACGYAVRPEGCSPPASVQLLAGPAFPLRCHISIRIEVLSGPGHFQSLLQSLLHPACTLPSLMLHHCVHVPE